MPDWKSKIEELLEAVGPIEDEQLRRDAFMALFNRELAGDASGSNAELPHRRGSEQATSEIQEWRVPSALQRLGVTSAQIAQVIDFDCDGGPGEEAPIILNTIPGKNVAERQRHGALLVA
ncbi:MAG: hypothetical protein ACOCZ7_01705, partial [Armatimonadota bacterium]